MYPVCCLSFAAINITVLAKTLQSKVYITALYVYMLNLDTFILNPHRDAYNKIIVVFPHKA